MLALEWVRPLPANVKFVGPVLPQPAQPLPSDLQVSSRSWQLLKAITLKWRMLQTAACGYRICLQAEVQLWHHAWYFMTQPTCCISSFTVKGWCQWC